MANTKKTPKTIKKRAPEIEEEEIEDIEIEDSAEEESSQIDVTKETKVAREQQLVSVSFTRNISPPPQIGHWVGMKELGVAGVRTGEQYKVPRYVAEALHDAKAVVIAH